MHKACFVVLTMAFALSISIHTSTQAPASVGYGD